MTVEERAKLIATIQEMAEIAGIPIERRDKFQEWLLLIFDDVTRSYERGKEPRNLVVADKGLDKKMKALHSSIVKVQRLLEKLKPSERRRLGLLGLWEESFGGISSYNRRFLELAELLDHQGDEKAGQKLAALEQTLAEMAAATSKQKRGRREMDDFDFFVWALVYAAVNLQGSVTLNPAGNENARISGTLIQLLEKARPHLPEGFVPSPLTRHRLEPRKKDAEVAARSRSPEE